MSLQFLPQEIQCLFLLVSDYTYKKFGKVHSFDNLKKNAIILVFVRFKNKPFLMNQLFILFSAITDFV